MIAIVGMVLVVALVFGGYLAAGGKIGIILQALPFELTMIGGAAVGAFCIANDMPTIKHTLKDLKRVVKGPQWKPSDYEDLLCLLFSLIKIGRRDAVALDTHVEDPQSSPIFQAYPRILADTETTGIICDTLRISMMNYDDPHQLEPVLEKQLDGRLKHALHSTHALQAVADGLPALGIVAAVLGIIKTMASIDQPPEVLGKMIGAALVGTFLGVFLAYGFVAPMGARVRSSIEEDQKFYELIRDTMVASMHKHSPQLCVEVARQHLPVHLKPSFDQLDAALKSAGEAA
ncbi:MAG: flagellar motor stator protein MotA [Pseudomonadota bacterium]